MPTHPTKLVITGVPPGQTADALVDRYRAPLRRFHSAQQQNVSNSVQGMTVHHAQQSLDDAEIHYSNIFGQETLTLTVHPQVIRETRARIEEPTSMWVLIEIEIPDMVGFMADISAEVTKGDNVATFLAGAIENHPSPTISDSNYTYSLLVDVSKSGGQTVEIQLSGRLVPRIIVGGNGQFREVNGTVQSSHIYGRRSLSSTRPFGGLEGPSFLPAALISPPLTNWLENDQADDPPRAIDILAGTFPEWSSASVYEFIGDHSVNDTQNVEFIGRFFITADLPTRWSFLMPWPGNSIGSPGIPDMPGTGVLLGIDPNSYSVYPYYSGPVTTYWDDDHLFTKTVTRLGYETDLGPTFPIPPPPGVTTHSTSYINGVEYHVPTWRYELERTAEIRAVSARYNPWTRTSHRFEQGDRIPGEDDLPSNDCYRWEASNFPERIRMEVLASGIALVTSDGDLSTIGKLKIDSNSGKVTFKAGEGD